MLDHQQEHHSKSPERLAAQCKEICAAGDTSKHHANSFVGPHIQRCLAMSCCFDQPAAKYAVHLPQAVFGTLPDNCAHMFSACPDPDAHAQPATAYHCCQ